MPASERDQVCVQNGDRAGAAPERRFAEGQPGRPAGQRYRVITTTSTAAA